MIELEQLQKQFRDSTNIMKKVSLIPQIARLKRKLGA